MNLTEQPQQPQQPQQPSMMGTNKKGSTGEEFDKGKNEIKKVAANVAGNPKVVAAKDAAQEGVKKVGRAVAGLFGLGKEKQEQHPGQTLMGGKRRRKSRRKKRTKRRRKSRRKKRRTKRRRKSRRKRRR